MANSDLLAFPPPLLHTRSPRDEFIAAVVVPSIFGILTGLALGWNELVYVVLAVLVAIPGGFLAGAEHDVALEGTYRGLLGGLLFGTWILVAHGLADAEPKADLPDPEILQVVITATLGAILGTFGARWRARREPAAPDSATA